MLTVHPQFITDTAGKKLVILPMKEFKTIMEELEELEDVKLYDSAKARKETSVPIEEAFKLIEAKRKKKK
jgi:PHD/YefM family antitoxin component YafN of YafNO toxin-antitoxin module